MSRRQGRPRRCIPRAAERFAPKKLADRSDDAVLITPAGVQRGKDGIRAEFTKMLVGLPNAAWDLKTQICEYDELFLEWVADPAASFVDDGIDTFVFRDGLIRAQTVR